MAHINCRYCNSDHGDRFLCDPAKRVLDAMLERGMQFDMPTLEFPDAITGPDALGDGMILMRQLVTKAAVLPVAGTPQPALVFTGQDIRGGVLPQWVLPGSGQDLRRAAALVGEMTEMAIRRARNTPVRLAAAGRVGIRDRAAVVVGPALDFGAVPDFAHVERDLRRGEVGPGHQLLDPLAADAAEHAADFRGADEVVHGRNHSRDATRHLTSRQD